jgi:ribosomal protein S18 acetylase RimI-like enzyme
MPPAAGLALLRSLDGYLDAAPRTAARAEHIGPFTLFVNEGPGWRYYARPTPGTGAITSEQIAAVVARQRELQVPLSFEWVADLVPGMARAATDAGLQVLAHPLMYLEKDAFVPSPAPSGFEIRLVAPGDDLAPIQAVGGVAFQAAGTEPGSDGPEAVRAAAASVPAALLPFVRDRLERRVTVTAAAFDQSVPIAIGSHQPVGGVTEIVGVGTVPAFRRRGLGTALTSMLVEDAFARGVEDVFLSAGDDTIARVYARMGFTVIGTAGAAEPRESSR